MASASARKAVAPIRSKHNNYDWDDIKPEALRLLAESNTKNKLKTTMNKIEKKFDFKRSISRWKEVIKAWDVKLNITDKDKAKMAAIIKKRSLEEGKETEIWFGGNLISHKRIKRRKTSETEDLLAESLVTPLNFTYNTPAPECHTSGTYSEVNGEPILDPEESVVENEGLILCDKQLILDNEELILDNKEVVLDNEELTSHDEELISYDKELILNNEKLILLDGEHILDHEELILRHEEPILDDQEVLILDHVLPHSTVPFISILDYLEDEDRPFYSLDTRPQLRDYSATLAMLRQITAEVEGIFSSQVETKMTYSDFSDERSSLLSLSGVGAQFLLDDGSAIAYEQLKPSKAIVLGELCDPALSFVISHGKHGEFATQTMAAELGLAIELYENNYFEEAEYHLRRLLPEYTPSVVPIRLGMLLLYTGRQNESVELLFSYLSGFIVDFPCYTIDVNLINLKAIDFLFTELARVGALQVNWKSLASCMRKITASIQESDAQGTVHQILPELLVHGLSMAHECSALGIINPAKDLYRVLVKHCHQLDDFLYGVEKVSAHRTYGLLLMREQSWISSAKQLLLALQSATNLITPESHLNGLLTENYHDLIPRLVNIDGEEESLFQRLRELVHQIQPKPSLRSPLGTSKTLGHQPREILPFPEFFTTLVRLPAFDVSEPPLRMWASTANGAEEDYISATSGTRSSMGSKKIGVTYTESVITGISHSSSDFYRMAS